MHTYPESNVRAAPIPPRPIPTATSIPITISTHTPPSPTSDPTTPSSPAHAPARTGRSYDAYPTQVPHEVSPGLMSDGTISSNHPLVRQFLDYTAQKFLQTEALAAVTGPHTKPSWHIAHKHHAVTRWRVEHGGVARVEDVHAVLGPGATDRLARAIFALGALAVFARWGHPAHWAFWAKDAREGTAALVHRVVRADPKEIYVPKEVAWVDEQTALYALGSWHGNWFLIDVIPEKRYIPHPDKEPKEKKKKTKGVKSSKSSGGELTNANGKRALSAEDGLAVPPMKRQRQTQDKTETGPPRRSTRVRKTKGADGESVLNPDSTAEAASASTSEVIEQIAKEPEDVVVDVESIEPGVAVDPVEPGAATEPGAAVDPIVPGEAMETGLEGQTQKTPAARNTKGSRSRSRRPKIGMKRKGVRKPRVPPGRRDAPLEPLLPASPSSTPMASPFAQCTIARTASTSTSPSPATAEVVDQAPAAPASGETTAAASRESSVTGTPSSEPSTCVGTPPQELEVKVEPAMVKLKGIREVLAPVRASARIRAKKLAIAFQQ